MNQQHIFLKTKSISQKNNVSLCISFRKLFNSFTGIFNVANKNKVSRCSGFRLFLSGELIISRYKYHSSNPPPPPPCSLNGGSKGQSAPPEGGLWKITKGVWKYGAGAGLLKRGMWAGHFFYLIFSGLSFLHLEITSLPFAKLCYAFEEKTNFLAT